MSPNICSLRTVLLILKKNGYKKELISSSMQQKQSLALIFQEAMKKVSKAALKLSTFSDIVNVLNENT